MSEAGTRARLRLFLDANVFVSGLMFNGPERSLLVRAEIGDFQAITSRYVLAQVERVVVTRFGRSAELVAEALARVNSDVTPEPDPSLVSEAAELLRDPTDAPVLAAAWEAGVDGLVTGDGDFFALKSAARVALLHTREAISLIDN